MSSYDQGRMDAWERIDALKRRLGLLGFFNEQKIKRYPKGHPKAGQFMNLPDEPMKAKVSKEKKSVVDISEEKSTEINGHQFSLQIGGLVDGDRSSPQRDFPVMFLANGETTMQSDVDPVTKKKAAFWWRRQSLDLSKKLPEGTVLSCFVENRDEEGGYRSRFYEALGFGAEEKGAMYSIIKRGKLSPVSKAEAVKAPRRFLVGKESLPYVEVSKLGSKNRTRKIELLNKDIEIYNKKIDQLAKKPEDDRGYTARFEAERKMAVLQKSQLEEEVSRNRRNSERIKTRSKAKE